MVSISDPKRVQGDIKGETEDQHTLYLNGPLACSELLKIAYRFFSRSLTQSWLVVRIYTENVRNILKIDGKKKDIRTCQEERRLVLIGHSAWVAVSSSNLIE